MPHENRAWQYRNAYLKILAVCPESITTNEDFTGYGHTTIFVSSDPETR